MAARQRNGTPGGRLGVRFKLRFEAFTAGASSWRSSGSGNRSRRACGQDDPDERPLADFALELDPAAVLGDDPVADAQAEAGPPADRFRGEEGVEDLRPHLVRNAAAVVGDLDHHVVHDRPGRDPEGPLPLAAVIDGLDGVHQELKEHLVDRGRRALEVGDLGVVARHPDLRPRELFAEEPEGLVERLVQVELGEPAPVEPGEGAEVRHDPGDPLPAPSAPGSPPATPERFC